MISLHLRDGAPYGVATARMSPLLTLLLLKPDIQKTAACMQNAVVSTPEQNRTAIKSLGNFYSIR